MTVKAFAGEPEVLYVALDYAYHSGTSVTMAPRRGESPSRLRHLLHRSESPPACLSSDRLHQVLKERIEVPTLYPALQASVALGGELRGQCRTKHARL
jgi:hypothetical protein